MSAAGIGTRLVSTAAILLLATGCAALPDQVWNRLDLGPLPPPPPNALMCGIARDTTVQDHIGSSGSSLRLPNGHVLVVPATTVNQPVRFHMTERAADYIVVKLGPRNRPFNPPVEVTLSSARCGTAQPSDLAVYRWRNPAEGWVRVPVDTIERVGNGQGLTARFRADGFTNFSLVAP
jgi:hypothetical protein